MIEPLEFADNKTKEKLNEAIAAINRQEKRWEKLDETYEPVDGSYKHLPGAEEESQELMKAAMEEGLRKYDGVLKSPKMDDSSGAEATTPIDRPDLTQAIDTFLEDLTEYTWRGTLQGLPEDLRDFIEAREEGAVEAYRAQLKQRNKDDGTSPQK
jgi:hypothetical protein